MNDYDQLYNAFNQMKEQRNRSNFNHFMSSFEEGLVEDLDDLYKAGDMDKYNKVLNNLKSKGIRIFRNDATGEHKIKFI